MPLDYQDPKVSTVWVYTEPSAVERVSELARNLIADTWRSWWVTVEHYDSSCPCARSKPLTECTCDMIGVTFKVATPQAARQVWRASRS